MQGIFQGFELMPGDVPLTVALDMAMDGSGISHLDIAWDIICRSGKAGVVKE